MTSEEGRLTRQLRREGRRTSSTWAEEVLRGVVILVNEVVGGKKENRKEESDYIIVQEVKIQ